MTKIPSEVENILNEYILLWDTHLPGVLEGLYLHGSLSLEAYDRASDIDFAAVTAHHLTVKELQLAEEIHHTLAIKFPKPEMDGFYCTWDEIGKLKPANRETSPFFNGGKLGYSTRFNPVTWWLLKTKGIRIRGQERSGFNINLDSGQLVSFVIVNMNTYWAQRIIAIENTMDHFLSLSAEERNEELEWCVLGMLRQFFTIREHDIISKLGAGEYALKHVPMEWHGIIKDALAARLGRPVQREISERVRFEEMIKFLNYLLKVCNDYVTYRCP
ncbi:aminoglycoside adenylyltransferase domain-containing protein [Peribacillus deserti]|uniref:aminoglycoside adenylyltransferase domain-containing protein n=1 Tax=Peribacillus deserti TaxID=673318 RepID=UPI0015E09F67|nr:aminoglycoside adenylyltransferase domain-containing protein [Peribacillus deserti]